MVSVEPPVAPVVAVPIVPVPVPAHGVELGLCLRLGRIVLLLCLLLAVFLRVAAQCLARFLGHLAVTVGLRDCDVVVSFGAVLHRASGGSYRIRLLLGNVLVRFLLRFGDVLAHLARGLLPVAAGSAERHAQHRGSDHQSLHSHFCTPL